MKKAISPVMIDHSRDLRRNMTDAERQLWGILSNRQMNKIKFRRQVPLGGYIADFASHEAKLVIEVDGGQHGENCSSDEQRSHFIRGEGYRVLRFWNNEVLGNLEGVHSVIMRALNEQSPSPGAVHRPLPSRER